MKNKFKNSQKVKLVADFADDTAYQVSATIIKHNREMVVVVSDDFSMVAPATLMEAA